MTAAARRGGVVAAIALAVALSLVSEAAQLDRPPRRIVSIVPAVTEMLFAIGSGPDVIAVSSFDRAEGATELPRVGGLLDPDMEQVFSLRPDLVIMYGSQIDQQAQLRRAGIEVFSYRHGGLRDVTVMMRELGTLTGRAEAAEQMAAAIERELQQVSDAVAERPPPRTLLVFGREPDAVRNVYASGGVGFLHDMLEAAGGVNVLGDVRREAARPSSEMILAAAPEVIIELNADGATEHDAASGVEVWQPFSSIPAVRTGRVHVLSGPELVVPGPGVAAVTRRLAQLLHPDAF